MRCDAVLQALIEHSGLVAPAALVPLAAYYFAHRRASVFSGFQSFRVSRCDRHALPDAGRCSPCSPQTASNKARQLSRCLLGFLERGFSCLADRMVWWSVHVDIFSDECRIGFTDNVQSLLYSREAFMSYEEPHLWCYSDGCASAAFMPAAASFRATALPIALVTSSLFAWTLNATVRRGFSISRAQITRV